MGSFESGKSRELNVKIPLELSAWPHDGPRRASVNSFGFGGANAHVVLEDAAHYLERMGLKGRHTTVAKPQLPPTNGHSLTNGHSNGHAQTNGHALTNGHTNGHANGDAPPTNGHCNGDGTLHAEKPKLLVLSSYDQDGVKRSIQQLLHYLDTKPPSDPATFLDSLAYTLAEKRTAMPWKTFAIGSDIASLRASLASAPAAARSSASHVPRVALVFTGQGAQWFAMGRGLAVYEAFADSLRAAERTLRALGCPWSLAEELGRPEAESRLGRAEYSQPACTALQVALVDLLRQWGVRPAAVVGHSSGEIAAAYCAGAVTREDAVKIAWLRGQFAGTIAQRNLKGAMMAVGASGESLQERLAGLTAGKAVVAAFNSPKACTVSGDDAAIEELGEALRAEQIHCTKLNVEVAYHSPHMDVIREAYEAALASITTSAPTDGVPMFSSVTGALIHPSELGASYWVDNLVSPVNFTGALSALLHHSKEQKRSSHDRAAIASVFVEVGPHSALRSYVLDILASADKLADSLSYATLLRRDHDGVHTALACAGELHRKGCQLSLRGVNATPATAAMLVDLPPYAWNHALSFWEESRLSREHRMRASPRADLLGHPVAGSPEPAWRNFLHCSESPWIREHRVQGSVLYPGAGMVAMAVEGARRLADPGEELLGYELRDVAITTALRVPDDEKGVEVLVRFHPRRTGTKAAPSATLHEFAVSSWSEEARAWTVHFRGLVSVTYKSQLSPAMLEENALENRRYQDSFREARRKCQKPARSFLYDTVETIGMHYGKTFRNMTELYAGDSASYGIISVPDTKAVMPQGYEYPCVVHPATLDSVPHLLFPPISGADQSLNEAVVPFSFDRIFVSAELPSTPGTKLHGFSTAKKTSYTTWMSSITIATEDLQSPAIIMDGLGLASVGASSESQRGIGEGRAQCFDQVWHEDTDLIAPAQIKELVYKRTIPNEDDDSVLDKLEFVCLVYIRRILDWFEGDGKEYVPTDGFFRLFYEWMRERVAMFPPLPEDQAQIEAEMMAARKRIVTSNSGDITVQMVDRIGQNLTKIFTHEIEPLQVMLEGDLLYTFYRGAFGTSFNSNVAEYVGMVADKHPGLAILEIGAGTGGTTYHVLERLRNADGTSKVSRYFFTDISPGFLAKAAERFSKDAAIMKFGTLNVEDDPLGQGFQPESFDVIVCANVLHATKSIQETLAHCHCLLKPGGKLVLSEVTIKRIFCGFIMGPLPGWWLGEDDGRKGGPLLDVEEWDAALKQADFSGVDMDVRGDCDASKEPVSLLVSTKPATTQPPPAAAFAIIGTGTAASDALAAAIQQARGDGVDHEFAARGATVYVPRVEKAPAVDAALRLHEARGEPEPVSFIGCGRPLKLTVKTPGLLDTFRWEEDETHHAALADGWVEIQVKAVGLNFKDVLVAMGNLNENKLGVDVSGVVTRVGGAMAGVKPGDRVMTSSCDTFATYVRFPAKAVIPVPEKMSFEDAASMPLIYLTAYYALVTVGRLQAGESILIHAAAGGVGQAAIAVAQHIGAEIFATVGSPEKKELIMRQYGIAADHIFSSRDLSFAKGVQRMTSNQGVDVVLNSLAGEALRLSWHCLAKFGRFLEIGKADLFANTGLDMLPFLENKSYCGVNLIDFENNPTPRAVRLFGEVAELIAQGAIKPVQPVQLFSFAEVEKAFRYMQTGKHMGQIVVRVDEHDLVPAIPRTPPVQVRGDATYVLAGGLGGICREIGRWLAEKGARHLVFLSRSAASGEDNGAYIQNLRRTYGTNALAFDRDVGDEASLRAVLDQIASLPPVRGCVTGAMVLRDTLFDKMTAADFRATVGPKVHGTWNLHAMLPADLDFFVMLSSLAGVMGHRGQGNYGAGNVFQDYFASHRRARGQRAMTIDIGYLLSVGFVAEHDEYVDHVKSMGLKVMHTSDLHGLLATAMDRSSSPHPPQIMCGLPANEHSDAWYWIADGKFAALAARCGDEEGEAVALVTRAVVERLAKLMMVPVADVDAGRPLSAYGVDSLVAVEVRNWIAREVGVEVSVFEIMANVPMGALAAEVVGRRRVAGMR
ncbi:Highly reducing polyketide synthase alt5 [Neofusicoccum ribis]|uniref:Highly reducing polyketide synthase alt5 n=1 Tax=Neofusicoccum ribis TaxID=45134 RepID=A0ABR3TG01_9PEZI